MSLRILAMSLVLALAAAHADARHAPLIDPEPVTLAAPGGSPLTKAEVRNAILDGAEPYGWRLVSETPTTLFLSYNKENKHEAKIRIDYDAQGYRISYVDSINLNFREQDGVREIHPNYNKWIDYLKERIRIRPPRPAAPAAAASEVPPAIK